MSGKPQTNFLCKISGGRERKKERESSFKRGFTTTSTLTEINMFLELNIMYVYQYIQISSHLKNYSLQCVAFYKFY